MNNDHHRKSIRLQHFDYSRKGLYYLTIVTHNREFLFGEVRPDTETGMPLMFLNEAGTFARKCWLEIPQHFPKAVLHEFIIMLDHVHGIIEFKRDKNPLVDSLEHHQFGKMIPRSVASVVKGFKIGVTKWVRASSPGKVVWHRDYYEHIIRDHDEYIRITDYISDNPIKWWQDHGGVW